MNHLKLLLTFDYELPLGGIVKSYRHSLFDPTDRLMELLEKLKVPAVFFADILSYVKFGEWDETGFAQAFKNQMQQAIYKGHDVQLHLHPPLARKHVYQWHSFTFSKVQNGGFRQ